MSLSLSEIVIVFFVFSVLGWIMEVTLKLIELGRFVNRGFLIGPYCPIYGFGVVFIILIIGDGLNMQHGIASTFFCGCVICGTLEYIVSYAMEKRYHARWWDYTNKPMNIHGRVWIGNIILFGLASVFILLILYPWIRFALDRIPEIAKWILSVLIIIEMSIDCIVSRMAMHVIRDEIDGTALDDSEEISTKIHKALKNGSITVSRLEKAYPTMRISPDILKQKLKEYEEKTRKALQELEDKKVEVFFSVSQKASELGDKMAEIDKDDILSYLDERKENILNRMKEGDSHDS
ncbi:MAG: hypothetical protein ACI4UK_07065 [Floccifex sp.]